MTDLVQQMAQIQQICMKKCPSGNPTVILTCACLVPVEHTAFWCPLVGKLIGAKGTERLLVQEEHCLY